MDALRARNAGHCFARSVSRLVEVSVIHASRKGTIKPESDFFCPRTVFFEMEGHSNKSKEGPATLKITNCPDGYIVIDADQVAFDDAKQINDFCSLLKRNLKLASDKYDSEQKTT